MADRGIIFSASMARALLDGRKTQTRRVLSREWQINGASWRGKSHDWAWNAIRWDEAFSLGSKLKAPWCHPDDEPTPSADCGVYSIYPPYAPGDRLWVREAWRAPSHLDDAAPVEMRRRLLAAGWDRPWAPILYEAGGDWCRGSRDEPGRPRSPIHMPRWASRLTLVVTEVRVQRLHEITGRDMIAEGVRCSGCFDCGFSACRDGGCFAQRDTFRDLWDSIHGPGAWDANPWVAAIRFTVHRCNIDAMEAQEALSAPGGG